jgi:CRISPR-associated protein Cmr4
MRNISDDIPKPASDTPGQPVKHPVSLKQKCDRLFFNLGFLDNLKDTPDLAEKWLPEKTNIQPDNLVVVDDADISLIHDMALYRQSRTKLKDGVKKVDFFFGFEALPEDSILIFPIAIKKSLSAHEKEALAELKQTERWHPFDTDTALVVQKSRKGFAMREFLMCQG